MDHSLYRQQQKAKLTPARQPTRKECVQQLSRMLFEQMQALAGVPGTADDGPTPETR